MTILTLPLAMPLHGEVHRDDATWVGLVEASDLDVGHDRIRLEDGDAFDRARILVRERGSVRGYVSLPITDGDVDAAALADAVEDLPTAQTPPDPAPRPITVIVCTRDRGALLRESLAAIRRIDYPLVEVIVVDNAPSDGETWELLRSEFPQFRYVREDAAGLSHARNAGLRAASSSIVAFTDDDVIVDPQWLWAIVAGFDRGDDVGCVTGIVPSGELRNAVQAWFDARVSWSKLTSARVFRLSDPPADLPMFPFCVGEFGTGANFAMRREQMMSLGGFDTALGAGTATKGGEDLDMFVRVLYDGRAIVVNPSAIVWHRHRDDLAALEAQAVGYGRGFGAWAATVASDPRTLGAAVRRSPQAVARLLHKPMSSVDETSVASALSNQSRGVGRLELASIFGGPAAYFTERRAQRAAGTFAGPPSRGAALDRRLWSVLAMIGGLFGLLALLPSPPGVSFAFLGAFILIGPGSLVRAWVVLPPHFAPIVIPALGISATLLLTTAIVNLQWWAPALWLLGFAAVVCAASVTTFTVRSAT